MFVDFYLHICRINYVLYTKIEFHILKDTFTNMPILNSQKKDKMKILLVEDSQIWQAKMRMILSELNFCNLHCCNDLNNAKNYLLENKPDLIIADIQLGEESFFDLPINLVDKNVPILFTTISEDYKNYSFSNIYNNSSFLVKPFHKLTVLSSIELLFKNSEILSRDKVQKGITVKGPHSESIFIKSESIVFVKATLNNNIIQTFRSKYIYKASLSNLLDELGDDMIKTHKSYLVNKKLMNDINLKDLTINVNNEIIPIGPKYKETVIQFITQNRII